MKCHACTKGTLRHKTKIQVYTYKGKSFTLQQTGLWCDTCQEGILSGDDIAKTEKAFEKFKAKVDDILTVKKAKELVKSHVKNKSLVGVLKKMRQEDVEE